MGGIAAAAEPSTDPSLGFECYSVHGRFFTSNGIGCRMWIVGTNRIVAIYNCDALPVPMDSYVEPPGPKYVFIYGDYQICPLEAERRGWMRGVKLVAAHHLVVERSTVAYGAKNSVVFRVLSTWQDELPNNVSK